MHKQKKSEREKKRETLFIHINQQKLQKRRKKKNVQPSGIIFAFCVIFCLKCFFSSVSCVFFLSSVQLWLVAQQFKRNTFEQ